MPKIKLLLFVFVLFFSSCHYQHSGYEGNWTLTNQQRDSIDFVINHHYTLNYNFTIQADSIVLHTNLPTELETIQLVNDSLVIYEGSDVVVADIAHLKTDTTSTFWIKVAHDQEKIGWIAEEELLKKAVPCDPISLFIHAFSNNHFYALYILLGIAALTYVYRRARRQNFYIVHFRDIHSFYPTLTCIITSIAATLYGSIQTFVPETWVEFYFHPTINPFAHQPVILSAFLVFVWLLLITIIATIDEVLRQLERSTAIAYLFSLACTCLVLYIFFSLTIRIYIGYLFLVLYILFALRAYFKHYRVPYICGNCGKPIDQLGKCPYCGAHND